MNLKEAIANNKIDEFIKEREAETGDKDQFDAAMDSILGKSSTTQETSSQDDGES